MCRIQNFFIQTTMAIHGHGQNAWKILLPKIFLGQPSTFLLFAQLGIILRKTSFFAQLGVPKPIQTRLFGDSKPEIRGFFARRIFFCSTHLFLLDAKITWVPVFFHVPSTRRFRHLRYFLRFFSIFSPSFLFIFSLLLSFYAFLMLFTHCATLRPTSNVNKRIYAKGKKSHRWLFSRLHTYHSKNDHRQ